MRPLDQRLTRRARAVRPFLITSSLLGAMAGLTVIVQAGLLAKIVSRTFLGGAGLAELRGLFVALAVVIAMRAAIAWAQEATSAHAAGRVKQQLRHQLLRHVLDLGPGWMAEQQTADISQLATRGVDSLDGYFTKYLPQVVLAVVVPVLVIVRMAFADPLSAIIVGVTLPLLPLFAALVGWTTQRKTDRQWDALQRLSHHFLDVLDGLPVLRTYRRGRAQGAAIRAATDDYRRTTLSVLRVSFLSSFVLELTATLSVALVAVSVGLRLVSDSIPFEPALLVLILVPEAYLPLRQMGANYHAAAEGLVAIDKIVTVLETPLPTRGQLPAPDLARVGLAVEHVRVRYPGREHDALTDVSLQLIPGELLALSGRSGCGKSTLIAVMLAHLDPSVGRVLAGNCELSTLDPRSWADQIAWLPQRPALVAGSVADNVRLGAADASDADVAAALAGAAAEELSLDLRLGEDGAGLSAGQRQRVALARALLRCTRGAGLLLLDEPTEHLDTLTEARVLQTLRTLAHDAAQPRCVLMVTHREAAVRCADRVLRLPAPTVDVIIGSAPRDAGVAAVGHP